MRRVSICSISRLFFILVVLFCLLCPITTATALVVDLCCVADAAIATAVQSIRGRRGRPGESPPAAVLLLIITVRWGRAQQRGPIRGHHLPYRIIAQRHTEVAHGIDHE